MSNTVDRAAASVKMLELLEDFSNQMDNVISEHLDWERDYTARFLEDLPSIMPAIMDHCIRGFMGMMEQSARIREKRMGAIYTRFLEDYSELSKFVTDSWNSTSIPEKSRLTGSGAV